MLSARIYLSALLLFAVLFSGCIRDDLSDCPAGLKIRFNFEPATYARTGVNPEEVDRVDLFVFDSRGIFRGRWVDEHPVLALGYTMTIPSLPTGDYRFIVWGGLHKCYSTQPTIFTVGKTTFSEVQLQFDTLFLSGERGTHPLFYSGKMDYIQNNARQQQIDLSLVQAYNTICLTTEGLPGNEDEFRLSITDNNGNYYFDYSFASCCEFTYTTLCAKNAEGQLEASLNVLKLADGRHPQLEIYNISTQETLYSVQLMELLNKIDGINYERVHTYDIHIRFHPGDTGLAVSVSINGWQVTEESQILY